MTERERFEAWAKSVPAWNLSLRRRDSGEYYYDATVLAWAAWQAAQKQETKQ